MREASKAPRYLGLSPASPRASSAAKAASRKRNTRCEIALRRALWRRGLRYRIDVAKLPGRPDIVFVAKRVVVFCDGDFWHGRNATHRLRKLKKGHNANYWVAKIKANASRDVRNTRALRAAGWRVLRVWETDVLRDVNAIAERLVRLLRSRSQRA